MRGRLYILVALITLLPAARADAVLVILKGQSDPVVGFLVSRDVSRIVIQELLPDGSRRRRSFLSTEVQLVVETVTPSRLAGLDPSRPEAYRNYAEELAEKRRDPEAREAALRLYLIAARLDPKTLGHSCLLGMIDLARNSDEERGFRALAYLLDPEHDPRVLRPPAEVKVDARVEPRTREELRRAMQLLRQGMSVGVRQRLADAKILALLKQYRSVITVDEINKARLAGSLPPEMLKKVVLMELALSMPSRAAGLPKPKTDIDDTVWSEGIRRHGTLRLPSLSLETITEFDPRACLFRDGRWVQSSP